MNQDIERAEIARAAYYAARAAAEAAYYAYVAARRKRPRKGEGGSILIANELRAAAAAYDAATSAYVAALDEASAALDKAAGLDGAAGAEASKSRYEWYRSAPGISSRAHDIVKFTED